MTFILGLTGSIATGKSTVLDLFAKADIPIYSADQAVYQLYEGEAVEPVRMLFPDAIENDRINRARLATIITKSPEKLPALEAIVHPLVRQKTLQFLDNHTQSQTPLIVLEIPLLFEVAHSYPLDAIAVTWCDPETQKKRAMARPGMTVDKLNTILDRQMSQAEKKERADFLISTGIELAQTNDQVSKIIKTCRERGLSAKG